MTKKLSEELVSACCGSTGEKQRLIDMALALESQFESAASTCSTYLKEITRLENEVSTLDAFNGSIAEQTARKYFDAGCATGVNIQPYCNYTQWLQVHAETGL